MDRLSYRFRYCIQFFLVLIFCFASLSAQVTDGTPDFSFDCQAASESECRNPVGAVPANDTNKSSHAFALRTNLLYDAALVPNLGIEYFFDDRWSVSANWMYAWWKNDNIHWYWRVYGGDIEMRFWFGNGGYGGNFTGHHLGVYAQAGTFDFELGNKGQMVDKWGFGGGLSYGYSLRLAERLNMDFSVGLGCFKADFKEYIPVDGHYVWQLTKRRTWIGPTRVEVGLVWIIGGGKR